MNKTKLGILILMVSFIAMSCKEKNGHHDSGKHEHMMKGGHHEMHNKTKLVVIDHMQFAFDLMPIEGHMKMMDKMHMKMKHHEGATHGLMITLMNKKTNNLVKDARVRVDIQGQTGESFSEHCEEMTGAGMHHYGVHLKLSDKNTYKVKATAKVNDKTFTAETEFKN